MPSRPRTLLRHFVRSRVRSGSQLPFRTRTICPLTRPIRLITTLLAPDGLDQASAKSLSFLKLDHACGGRREWRARWARPSRGEQGGLGLLLAMQVRAMLGDSILDVQVHAFRACGGLLITINVLRQNVA